jgi:hypothetical protein
MAALECSDVGQRQQRANFCQLNQDCKIAMAVPPSRLDIKPDDHWVTRAAIDKFAHPYANGRPRHQPALGTWIYSPSPTLRTTEGDAQPK